VGQDADVGLIDEALAVVHDARVRAPREFLLALAVILGVSAPALVAGAAVTGALEDLLLKSRRRGDRRVADGRAHQRAVAPSRDGASAALDAMSVKLKEHRGSPMSEEERQAWRIFVDEYRALVRAESLFDRVLALPIYRRRIRELESRGNRTLEEFKRAAADAPWPEQ
jgi:hypothetical protein